MCLHLYNEAIVLGRETGGASILLVKQARGLPLASIDSMTADLPPKLMTSSSTIGCTL